MARPKIDISKSDFEKLCAIWCTLRECAGYFGCSEDTIERWCKRTYKLGFADIYEQKAATGTVSIRRKQFELAQKGNVALLIWLGKQKLGQRDQPEQPPAVQVNTNAEGETVVKVWTTVWGGGNEPTGQ